MLVEIWPIQHLKDTIVIVDYDRRTSLWIPQKHHPIPVYEEEEMGNIISMFYLKLLKKDNIHRLHKYHSNSIGVDKNS